MFDNRVLLSGTRQDGGAIREIMFIWMLGVIYSLAGKI